MEYENNLWKDENIMKLAEALIERASLKSTLEQIKSRMETNVSVQEGNTPAEDINELMSTYLAINTKFTDLICKIIEDVSINFDKYKKSKIRGCRRNI